MVTAADILRCPRGALLVVDGIVLSAWTQAYDREAVDLLDAASAQAMKNAPTAVGALGIYRLKSVRGVPDAETRSALIAVGHRYPFKVMATVLDSSGFGNAIIRMFLQGLGFLGGDSTMTIAGSIEQGIEQVGAAGLDTTKLRAAIELLTAEVYGA